jgi:hypothetical protein
MPKHVNARATLSLCLTLMATQSRADNYLFGDPHAPATVVQAERNIAAGSQAGEAVFGIAAPEVVEEIFSQITERAVSYIFGSMKYTGVASSVFWTILFGSTETSVSADLTNADRERFARERAGGNGSDPGDTREPHEPGGWRDAIGREPPDAPGGQKDSDGPKSDPRTPNEPKTPPKEGPTIWLL